MTSTPARHTVDWSTAVSATLHCLTGCAIGEVLGMIIGTALGWSNGQTIALPINRWMISRGRGHAVVHGHHG